MLLFFVFCFLSKLMYHAYGMHAEWQNDKEKVMITIKQVRIVAAANVLFLSLGGDFVSLHFVII